MDGNMIRAQVHTYEEAVKYLCDIPRFTSKHSMEDTVNFLHRLGDPDQSLKIIHVAGTNGKGSTCEYMRSILTEAGYTVSVFTSPHLVDIRERFMIRGQMISREVFLKAFFDVAGYITEEYHPTFFEYIFFMGMLIFAADPTDYLILETGLGGRLDATNSVARKELCVITRISLEHTQYLGDTIAKIAAEKAGIVRENTPWVYLDVEPEATDVFAHWGRGLRPRGRGLRPQPPSPRSQPPSPTHKGIDFSVYSRYYNYVKVHLSTLACYQCENASLAVGALEEIIPRERLTEHAIREGLNKAFWPGRMEELLPEVFVDGAHNDDGIRAFLESVASDGLDASEEARGRRLIFGVVQDKDHMSMIHRIVSSGLFKEVCLVSMETSRSTDIGELVREFDQELGGSRQCSVTIGGDPIKSLKEMLKRRGEGERIYVAGSLYLVGEMKGNLEE